MHNSVKPAQPEPVSDVPMMGFTQTFNQKRQESVFKQLGRQTTVGTSGHAQADNQTWLNKRISQIKQGEV